MVDLLAGHQAVEAARRAAREARGEAARVEAVARVVRLAVGAGDLLAGRAALAAAFSDAEALALEFAGAAALRPALDAYDALARRRLYDQATPEFWAWLRSAEALAALVLERDGGPEAAYFVARVAHDLAGALERLAEDAKDAEDAGDELAPALREALRAGPAPDVLRARALGGLDAAASSTEPATLAALVELALELRGPDALAPGGPTALALAEGRGWLAWARRTASAPPGPLAAEGDVEALLRARGWLQEGAGATPSGEGAAWAAWALAELGGLWAERGELGRAEACVRAALRWADAAGGANGGRALTFGLELDQACRRLGEALAGADEASSDELLRRAHHVDDAVRFYRKPAGGLAEVVRDWHLLTPEAIRSWSYGCVREPDAFDEAGAPTPAGPACQRTFGPARDRSCGCGTYGPADEGLVCEACGVEVIASSARRRRLGHVELAAPVVHPFFGPSAHPSAAAALLGVTREALREVAHGRARLVLDLWHERYKPGELWAGDAPPEGEGPDLATGVGAIRTVLRGLHLPGLVEDGSVARPTPAAERRALVARALGERRLDPGDALVLDCLPVLPPDFWAHEFGPERGGRLRDEWFRRLGDVVRANRAVEASVDEGADDGARARAAAELADATGDLFSFCHKALAPPPPAPEG
jgi:hypothetical protein